MCLLVNCPHIYHSCRVGNIPDGNMKHFEYLDGSYLENWQNADPVRLAKTLNLVAEATRKGKIIMLNAHPQGFDESFIKTIRQEAQRYRAVGKQKVSNKWLLLNTICRSYKLTSLFIVHHFHLELSVHWLSVRIFSTCCR